MEDSVEYRKFTVNDVRNWIYDNCGNGLSETIITRIRAFAIINNPYVHDDMVVIVTAYVRDEVVGYTAIFPEMLERPHQHLCSVATTLYVNPKFEGQFISYYLMLYIKESSTYSYIGLDSTPAAVLVDQLLGSSLSYYKRWEYLFRRSIQIKNIRSILTYCKNKYLISRQSFKLRSFRMFYQNVSYGLEYINYIDPNLFTFIKQNSHQDLFLRSRDTFNWILRYPFIIESPCIDLVPQKNIFSAHISKFRTYAVKVLSGNETIGFFILRYGKKETVLRYCYYTPTCKETVFCAIIEHIHQLDVKVLKSCHVGFDMFLEKHAIYLRKKSEQISFTYPITFPFDASLNIQGGDGDMMA